MLDASPPISNLDFNLIYDQKLTIMKPSRMSFLSIKLVMIEKNSSSMHREYYKFYAVHVFFFFFAFFFDFIDNFYQLNIVRKQTTRLIFYSALPRPNPPLNSMGADPGPLCCPCILTKYSHKFEVEQSINFCHAATIRLITATAAK